MALPGQLPGVRPPPGRRQLEARRAAGPADPARAPRLDEHAIRLLDEAEDIVNAAAPAIMSEVGADKARRALGRGGSGGREPWWRRFGKRR